MLASYDSAPWVAYALFGVVSLFQGALSMRRHGSSRRLAVKQFAGQHGLTFGDSMQLSGAPLEFPGLSGLLLQQSGVENALMGSWAGVRVLAGDLWSRDQSVDGRGPGSRRYRSIAIVSSGKHLPFVRVRRVGSVRQALDTAAGLRVRFDSEEFNRRFQVVADSTQEAFAVIDQRMMQWLMESAGPCTYETGPGGVLATSDLVAPTELGAFLDAAAGFAGHVPRAVEAKEPAGAGTWFAGPGSAPATAQAGQSPTRGATPIPPGATVATITSVEPMQPGDFDAVLRSPTRVILQTNVFGFHSSDSIAGGELRNAFRNGTWSRDPHLRRFVIKQSCILLIPFVLFAVVQVLQNGPWAGAVPFVVIAGVALMSLTRMFHRT